jgi:predicted site-specific integrase-resolvase
MKKIHHDGVPKLVTFGKLAEIYEVSPYTVRGWKQRGCLPGLRKVGGRYRVDLAEFKKSTQIVQGTPPLQ